MRLLTWNIQCGLGCDGRVDLGRIADIAKEMGDPDVLCLQEVSTGFAPAGAGDDQPRQLAALFPDHHAIFGAAVETADGTGTTRRFGNIVLSRLPVLSAERHLLPWRPGEDVRSMRRQATSVLVETGFGPVSITTTHLEYHSDRQRRAQVERLTELLAEERGHAASSFADLSEGPYRTTPRAVGQILCGDFNFGTDDALHAALSRDLKDAWRLAYPGEPHAPTCGIFDRKQWSQGPHCRDFVFVSPSLAERVDTVTVNAETDASDHQPVMLTLQG